MNHRSTTMLSLDEIGLKYAYGFGKGKNYVGGDKTSLGNNFTETYEKIFEPMREQKINLLELGVLTGRSIAMWSDYFSQASIHGIDISLAQYYENERELKKHSAFKNNNVILIEADITSDQFKDVIKNDLPMFDIVIDDALHTAKQQFDNFINLFNNLNKGGYYVVEDVIEPENLLDRFADIIKCSMNSGALSSKQKQNKYYSIATKIDSIVIKQNLIIIKKK